MRRWWWLIPFLLVVFYLAKPQPKKKIHVYGWYELIPDEVIRKFEKETGIKVVWDQIDSNDVLETKLLAGRSGYDVVTPTAIPYFARMLQLNLLKKIDKSKMPNLKNLDPVVVEKFKDADANFEYGIPYGYGTYGLIYNETYLKKIGLDLPEIDYDVLFKIDLLKKIAPYGVSLLEEAFDVIPVTLGYLGLDKNSDDPRDLRYAEILLKKIRPFIKKFTSFRYISDLMINEIVLAQATTQEAIRAIEEAKEWGITLKFVASDKIQILYIDVFAIPVDAPHPVEAHMFLNFLCRPDIAGIITNKTFIANSVSKKHPEHVRKDLVMNKNMFLDPLENYNLLLMKHHDKYRAITQIWTRILLGG